MSKEIIKKTQPHSIGALRVVACLKKHKVGLLVRLPDGQIAEFKGEGLNEFVSILRSSHPDYLLPAWSKAAMLDDDSAKLE
jgi:hypothetical protein